MWPGLERCRLQARLRALLLEKTAACGFFFLHHISSEFSVIIFCFKTLPLRSQLGPLAAQGSAQWDSHHCWISVLSASTAQLFTGVWCGGWWLGGRWAPCGQHQQSLLCEPQKKLPNPASQNLDCVCGGVQSQCWQRGIPAHIFATCQTRLFLAPSLAALVPVVPRDNPWLGAKFKKF